MWRKRSEKGRDDAPRQVWTELDALLHRVSALQADVTRLETEWADAKDQLRRSYQRMERASQRLAERQTPPQEGSSEGPQLQSLSDGFSRTLSKIREQRGA